MLFVRVHCGAGEQPVIYCFISFHQTDREGFYTSFFFFFFFLCLFSNSIEKKVFLYRFNSAGTSCRFQHVFITRDRWKPKVILSQSVYFSVCVSLRWHGFTLHITDPSCCCMNYSLTNHRLTELFRCFNTLGSFLIQVQGLNLITTYCLGHSVMDLTLIYHICIHILQHI